MNEEQQIKEMAINLCGRKDFSNMCPYSGEECDYSCTYIDDADNLVCAGYGNVNEAVKEFAERLKKKKVNLTTHLRMEDVIDEAVKDFCGENE